MESAPQTGRSSPGEGKLAEEESVVGRCINLARCRQNGKQNGQIVCCSCLFCVGRCEVDGQSGHRPVKGAGLCGGTDALSGFGYRAGRQTDDIQPGKTAGEEALDGDNVAVNAAQPAENTRDTMPIPPILMA